MKVGKGLDFSAEMLEHNVGDTRRLSLPDPECPLDYGRNVLTDSFLSQALSIVREESDEK